MTRYSDYLELPLHSEYGSSVCSLWVHLVDGRVLSFRGVTDACRAGGWWHVVYKEPRRATALIVADTVSYFDLTDIIDIDLLEEDDIEDNDELHITPSVRILRNAARCLECGDLLESRSKHDFVQCTCGNLFVDGGLDYLRGGVRNSDLVEWLYATDPATPTPPHREERL